MTLSVPHDLVPESGNSRVGEAERAVRAVTNIYALKAEVEKAVERARTGKSNVGAADAEHFQGAVILTSPTSADATDLRPRGATHELKGAQPVARNRRLRMFGPGLPAFAMSDNDALVSVIRAWRQLTDAVAACPVPVVAAIHGRCTSLGLELALACDGMVATPGSTLGLPEVPSGLVPAAGGGRRLMKRMGVRGGLEFMISGACACRARVRA